MPPAPCRLAFSVMLFSLSPSQPHSTAVRRLVPLTERTVYRLKHSLSLTQGHGHQRPLRAKPVSMSRTPFVRLGRVTLSQGHGHQTPCRKSQCQGRCLREWDCLINIHEDKGHTVDSSQEESHGSSNKAL